MGCRLEQVTVKWVGHRLSLKISPLERSHWRNDLVVALKRAVLNPTRNIGWTSETRIYYRDRPTVYHPIRWSADVNIPCRKLCTLLVVYVLLAVIVHFRHCCHICRFDVVAHVRRCLNAVVVHAVVVFLFFHEGLDEY